MKSHTNTYCATCLNAFNAINGRFCTVMRHYVEYAPAPMCESETENTNQ